MQRPSEICGIENSIIGFDFDLAFSERIRIEQSKEEKRNNSAITSGKSAGHGSNGRREVNTGQSIHTYLKRIEKDPQYRRFVGKVGGDG